METDTKLYKNIHQNDTSEIVTVIFSGTEERHISKDTGTLETSNISTKFYLFKI